MKTSFVFAAIIIAMAFFDCNADNTPTTGISNDYSSPVSVKIQPVKHRPRQLLPEEGDVNLTCEYFRGSLSFRFAESEGNASVTVTLPDGALVKSAFDSTFPYDMTVGEQSGIYYIEVETGACLYVGTLDLE